MCNEVIHVSVVIRLTEISSEKSYFLGFSINNNVLQLKACRRSGPTACLKVFQKMFKPTAIYTQALQHVHIPVADLDMKDVLVTQALQHVHIS